MSTRDRSRTRKRIKRWRRDKVVHFERGHFLVPVEVDGQVIEIVPEFYAPDSKPAGTVTIVAVDRSAGVLRCADGETWADFIAEAGKVEP